VAVHDDTVERSRLAPTKPDSWLPFSGETWISRAGWLLEDCDLQKGRANDDRSASANPGCLVLGTGAQPGHDAVNNRERGPAASKGAAARSALAPAMGLGSPASLLVGTTRPPVSLVVAARMQDSNLQQPI